MAKSTTISDAEFIGRTKAIALNTTISFIVKSGSKHVTYEGTVSDQSDPAQIILITSNGAKLNVGRLMVVLPDAVPVSRKAALNGAKPGKTAKSTKPTTSNRSNTMNAKSSKSKATKKTVAKKTVDKPAPDTQPIPQVDKLVHAVHLCLVGAQPLHINAALERIIDMTPQQLTKAPSDPASHTPSGPVVQMFCAVNDIMGKVGIRLGTLKVINSKDGRVVDGYIEYGDWIVYLNMPSDDEHFFGVFRVSETDLGEPDWTQPHRSYNDQAEFLDYMVKLSRVMRAQAAKAAKAAKKETKKAAPKVDVELEKVQSLNALHDAVGEIFIGADMVEPKKIEVEVYRKYKGKMSDFLSIYGPYAVYYTADSDQYPFTVYDANVVTDDEPDFGNYRNVFDDASKFTHYIESLAERPSDNDTDDDSDPTSDIRAVSKQIAEVLNLRVMKPVEIDDGWKQQLGSRKVGYTVAMFPEYDPTWAIYAAGVKPEDDEEGDLALKWYVNSKSLIRFATDRLVDRDAKIAEAQDRADNGTTPKRTTTRKAKGHKELTGFKHLHKIVSRNGKARPQDIIDPESGTIQIRRLRTTAGKKIIADVSLELHQHGFTKAGGSNVDETLGTYTDTMGNMVTIKQANMKGKAYYLIDVDSKFHG